MGKIYGILDLNKAVKNEAILIKSTIMKGTEQYYSLLSFV